MANLERIKERIPLFRAEFLEMYLAILENANAPRFNAECGDRLEVPDVAIIQRFSESLNGLQSSGTSADFAKEFFRTKRTASPYFHALDATMPWDEIAPMTRHDIRDRLHEIVPVDADLSRLILNPTSGTTGMPVQIPNTPGGVGHYQPLILEAIRRHGISLNPGKKQMAAVQVCAQSETMTYGTVHSFYDGAGFAKINLHPGGREKLLSEWPNENAPDAFLSSLKPAILTGDPFAFQLYLDYGIDYRPQAVLSTASTLPPDLRQNMEQYFRCPVIDFYSTNETGPLAGSCPEHPDRFHQLAFDIALEINPVTGTLLVTGGRNPLLPLLRYDTGDLCEIVPEQCSCGRFGYLQGLNGRPLVYFRGASGSLANPLDFARMLRFVPSRRHRIRQNSDGSMDIYVDPGSFNLETYAGQIESRGSAILDGLPVRVHPYEGGISEHPYEVIS